MENDNQNDLDTINRARTALAERLVTPWWYHPALGALVAGLALAYGFVDDSLWRTLSIFPFVAGCALLVTGYKRATGLWVDGYQPGPARIYAWGLGLIVLISMLGVIAVRWQGSPWMVWAIAAAAFLLTVINGRRFDNAYRQQLRTQS